MGWDKEKVDNQKQSYLSLIIENWNKEQRRLRTKGGMPQMPRKLK